MTARLGRPVRMTARKATDGSNFSYKLERSALYDLAGEKRVQIVAGDFEGATVGAAGRGSIARENNQWHDWASGLMRYRPQSSRTGLLLQRY
jgi:hypothetical protein